MKKWYSIVLGFLFFVHIANSAYFKSFEGSVDDNQGNFEQFSLILFILEKDSVRIERYGLEELVYGVNRLTRKISNAHCLYELNLCDYGHSVHTIGWHAQDMSQLIIETKKHKKSKFYELNWPMLIGNSGAQAQKFMHADARIGEVFSASLPKNKKSLSSIISWFTALAISWGLISHELVINIILARKVNGVAAVVVPNSFLKSDNISCVELDKHALMQLGVLHELSCVEWRAK